MSGYLQNWAEHFTFSTDRVYRPTTIAEVQEIVRNTPKLRVIGSRHSFNRLADSSDALISLENLEPALTIDADAQTVTAHGGISYGQLCQQLHSVGYAIHNMASLPHISVAGAIATATHGSGDSNGNLATAVAAIEVVKADGEIVTFSREKNREEFLGAVVNLGGIGVVSKVTLDIMPAYSMQQEVYEFLPTEQLEANFDAITSNAYSVSFFTDWQAGRVNQVWLKRRLVDTTALALAPDFFGSKLAAARLHPVVTTSSASCTEQMGIVGPWNERLPHFRMDHSPSSGNELQTEYFVARKDALAVARIITSFQPQFAHFLRIAEVRTVAADQLWMSPSYERATVGFHFTWHKRWDLLEPFLPLLEEALAPFDARPHWAKMFTMSPQRVQSLYPRLADFRALLQRYDPTGKFRNAYLDKYIFGGV